MFIETDDGRGYIALSSVMGAYEDRQDELHRLVVIHKGEHGITRTKVSAVAFETATRQTIPLIPALPGSYMVYYWHDGAEDGIARVPIVAWRANEFGNLDPVTVEGNRHDHVNILFPDGIVISPENQQWDNLEAFEHQMREERQKRDKETPA